MVEGKNALEWKRGLREEVVVEEEEVVVEEEEEVVVVVEEEGQAWWWREAAVHVLCVGILCFEFVVSIK